MSKKSRSKAAIEPASVNDRYSFVVTPTIRGRMPLECLDSDGPRYNKDAGPFAHDELGPNLRHIGSGFPKNMPISKYFFEDNPKKPPTDFIQYGSYWVVTEAAKHWLEGNCPGACDFGPAELYLRSKSGVDTQLGPYWNCDFIQLYWAADPENSVLGINEFGNLATQGPWNFRKNLPCDAKVFIMGERPFNLVARWDWIHEYEKSGLSGLLFLEHTERGGE